MQSLRLPNPASSGDGVTSMGWAHDSTGFRGTT
jgi:hypothetical protein